MKGEKSRFESKTTTLTASYRLSAPVTADECADDIVVRFDQLVA
jgi:hypothetical protein